MAESKRGGRQSSRLVHLLVLLMFLASMAGCGLSGGSGDGDQGDTNLSSPTGPVAELSGDPARAVTAAVSDLFAAKPVPAFEVGQDASGVSIVRSEIEIGLVDTATVADANRLLDGIDGEIVAMAKGVPQLLVRIPDPGSLAALDALIATLENDPAVAYVSRGVVPVVAGLPANVAASQASEMEKLRHQLALRAAGAWQARSALIGLGGGSSPPLVIMADAFGKGAPASDFDVLTDPENYATFGFDPHGYHVLGIMAAGFGGSNSDRGRITGLYPDTLDVSVIDVATGVSMNMMEWGLVDRVKQFPGRRIVVNTSIAYPCLDADSVAQYCNGTHARERALAWIDKIRGGGLEGRFLHVAAVGNVKVAGDRDATIASTFTAAQRMTNLRRQDGTPMAPLGNVLAVENLAASDQPPYRPVCLNGLSKRPGDLGAIGTDVWSLTGPDSGDGAAVLSGTSQAAPAVTAMAAYLWALRPQLSAAQLRQALIQASRPVDNAPLANAACDLLATPARAIDAYDIVLAADSDSALNGGQPADARVRGTILDVADASGGAGSNGQFDEHDLALWLQRLQLPQGGSPALDYSRFDLNGDGYTGGDGKERLDLDIDGLFETRVTQGMEGDSIDFDETALSDMKILCYYAYSPLYTGDSDARQRLMGPVLDQCGGKAWGAAERIVPVGAATAFVSSHLSDPLAVSDTGEAVVVWVQEQRSSGSYDLELATVYAAHFVPGSGWQAPVALASYPAEYASDAEVAINSAGDAVATWVHYDTADTRQVLVSRYSPGSGWGAVMEVSPGIGNAVRVTPQVAIDPQGNVIVLWQQYDNGEGVSKSYARRYADASGWDDSQFIGRGVVTQLAFDGSGVAQALGTRLDDVTRRYNLYAYRQLPGASWTATLIDADAQTDVGEHHLALSPSGLAVAAWWRGTNLYVSRYASGSWGRPVIISPLSNANGHPRVAINDAGQAIAVWPQWDDAAGVTGIHASRCSPQGVWGVEEPIVTVPAGMSATAPRVVLDGNGNGVAVWQQRDSFTETRIYANHSTPHNGWEAPEMIGGDTARAVAPNLAMDGRGNAIAVWLQAGTLYANRYE